jgi:hypothetical protein
MVGMLKWWFVFVCSVATLVGCALSGTMTLLWDIDRFKIGFVIIGVYLVLSTYIGRLTYQVTHSEYEQWKLFKSQAADFSVNLMTQLGLIGTVVGFMLLLGAVSHAGAADVAAATNTMQKITSSVSIALVNTLLGLVCNILLNIQVLNLNALATKAGAGTGAGVQEHE